MIMGDQMSYLKNLLSKTIHYKFLKIIESKAFKDPIYNSKLKQQWGLQKTTVQEGRVKM